jgi:hypothetical protein
MEEGFLQQKELAGTRSRENGSSVRKDIRRWKNGTG